MTSTEHAPTLEQGARSTVAVRDLFRGLTAAAVLLSAVVHLDLWASGGFRDIPTIGPLFLLNAVGGLVIGVLIVCWSHWLAPFLGAGFGLVTVVAFWVSVTIGLFGITETATGVPQLTGEITELAALGFGLVATVLGLRADRGLRAGMGWRVGRTPH